MADINTNATLSGMENVEADEINLPKDSYFYIEGKAPPNKVLATDNQGHLFYAQNDFLPNNIHNTDTEPPIAEVECSSESGGMVKVSGQLDLLYKYDTTSVPPILINGNYTNGFFLGVKNDVMGYYDANNQSTLIQLKNSDGDVLTKVECFATNVSLVGQLNFEDNIPLRIQNKTPDAKQVLSISDYGTYMEWRDVDEDVKIDSNLTLNSLKILGLVPDRPDTYPAGLVVDKSIECNDIVYTPNIIMTDLGFGSTISINGSTGIVGQTIKKNENNQLEWGFTDIYIAGKNIEIINPIPPNEKITIALKDDIRLDTGIFDVELRAVEHLYSNKFFQQYGIAYCKVIDLAPPSEGFPIPNNESGNYLGQQITLNGVFGKADQVMVSDDRGILTWKTISDAGGGDKPYSAGLNIDAEKLSQYIIATTDRPVFFDMVITGSIPFAVDIRNGGLNVGGQTGIFCAGINFTGLNASPESTPYITINGVAGKTGQIIKCINDDGKIAFANGGGEGGLFTAGNDINADELEKGVIAVVEQPTFTDVLCNGNVPYGINCPNSGGYFGGALGINACGLNLFKTTSNPDSTPFITLNNERGKKNQILKVVNDDGVVEFADIYGDLYTAGVNIDANKLANGVIDTTNDLILNNAGYAIQINGGSLLINGESIYGVQTPLLTLYTLSGSPDTSPAIQIDNTKGKTNQILKVVNDSGKVEFANIYGSDDDLLGDSEGSSKGLFSAGKNIDSSKLNTGEIATTSTLDIATFTIDGVAGQNNQILVSDNTGKLRWSELKDVLPFQRINYTGVSIDLNQSVANEILITDIVAPSSGDLSPPYNNVDAPDMRVILLKAPQSLQFRQVINFPNGFIYPYTDTNINRVLIGCSTTTPQGILEGSINIRCNVGTHGVSGVSINVRREWEVIGMYFSDNGNSFKSFPCMNACLKLWYDNEIYNNTNVIKFEFTGFGDIGAMTTQSSYSPSGANPDVFRYRIGSDD